MNFLFKEVTFCEVPLKYHVLIRLFQCSRAQVKSLLQSELESTPLASLESIGVQAIQSGQALSPSQLAALVDKVSVDDVNRVGSLF